jgi:outer membrane lipoprotein-sorting protein
MIARAAICAVLFTSTFGYAQTTREDSSLEQRLAAADAHAATVKDLTCHFEQEKVTAMLKEPLVSSGTVRTTGAVVRWDTEKPSPCVLYADAGEMRLYYPEQSLEEIYTIDQKFADLLASPLPRLKMIEAHFDIAPDPATRPSDADLIAVKLTPRDASLKNDIAEVDVLVDGRPGLATRVATVDPDGDTTTIRFSDVRVNTGLSEADLQLNVPPGTKISHPLDTGGDSSGGAGQ